MHISLWYTLFFFISNTFISNARLKLAKNQANAKQHPAAELLLFQNFSHFSSTLSSRHNGHILKNRQKNKYACIHQMTQLLITKMKMKMKKDHIYTTKIDLGQGIDTNIVINIRGVSVWWSSFCIKQHLSNTWSSIHDKAKQHWGWPEKKVCIHSLKNNSAVRRTGYLYGVNQIFFLNWRYFSEIYIQKEIIIPCYHNLR